MQEFSLVLPALSAFHRVWFEAPQNESKCKGCSSFECHVKRNRYLFR